MVFYINNLLFNLLAQLGIEPKLKLPFFGDYSPEGAESYLIDVVQSFILFGGVIAACLVVYGAYLFMTSSGESEKVEKAQRVLTNAFIGLAIAAVAFLIIGFVFGLIDTARSG